SGQQIKIVLVDSPQAQDWFLINPQVNVPAGNDPATVVLMRRSVFRKVAAEVRNAPRQKALSEDEWSAEDRKRALGAIAARYGLTAEQLETAIPSFAETQYHKDK